MKKYTLSEYIKKHGDEVCLLKFNEWLANNGYKLITLKTVADWRRQEYRPKPKNAKMIMAVSQGRVKWDGIYG